MPNKINRKQKVVVAMSGGVDSSVAAALLKRQGYEVIGIFMQFWAPSGLDYNENRCCSLKAWHEAQDVARILAIPIYKVNFGREFKKQIVDEFLAEYRAGHTPNPCVACNKFIKFDLLLKYSQTVWGADFLATGHYVRLEKTLKQKNIKTKKHYLYRPKDRYKDQTYFLYNLKQEQLKHLLFPLADYTKKQVRELAKKFRLPVFDKPDSQEICFVGRSHYDFLKKYLNLKAGEIVTYDSPTPSDFANGKIISPSGRGRKIGWHQGLPLYTLGQRSGLGLSGGPWYVVGFKRKSNQLIVSKNFYSSGLMKKKIKFKNANWLDDKIKIPLKCSAQIRYQAKPVICMVRKNKSGYVAEFAKPQRAAAPGQSIVFYDEDKLLGGGIIY